MDLDRSYFNSIRLNTHRGKYYDVEAVDRLLVDIRSRADSLNKEVIASRDKLAEAIRTADTLRDENTELFLKGQALSQEILSLREELRAAQAGEASLIPEDEAVPAPEEAANAESAPAWEENEEFYFLTEELPEPGKHSGKAEAVPQKLETAVQPSLSEAAEPPVLSEDAARKAEALLADARLERERILSEARLEREKTVERMERVFAMLKEISTYTIEKSERIHEEYLKAVAGTEPAPEDLSEKIGRIAAQLTEMEDDD